MKLKIRNGVFETNSSSQHTLCLTSNTEEYTPQEIKSGMWIGGDNMLHLYAEDLHFGRYPFCILSTFYDKLRYAIAALVGNNSYTEQDGKALNYLNALRTVCQENIDRFTDFEFQPLEYSRGKKLDYGYAQDYGGLETFLDKNNVSIEDFLVKKRYIVIVDGDEYNAWDKLKSSGIVNTSIIEKEVVMG